MSSSSVYSRFDRSTWYASARAKRDRDHDKEVEERNEEFYSKMYKLWERLEYYAFLLIGSVLWYVVVFKVLDWHRFPFHLYPTELWLIVIVPIFIIVCLLYLMDRIFPTKED